MFVASLQLEKIQSGIRFREMNIVDTEEGSSDVKNTGAFQ